MKKILFILLIAFTINVKAEVDCTKLMEIKQTCTAPNGLMNMSPGEEVSCSISFKTIVEETCTPTKETLKEASFNLNIPSTLSISDETVGTGFTKSGTNPITFTRPTGLESGVIYSYKIKTINVSEDKNYNLSISNLEIKNNEGTDIDASLYGENISFKVIRPKSIINTLDELRLFPPNSTTSFNLTPAFSSDILNYTLTVDTNTTKVNITAKKTDDLSTLSGNLGEKLLNYGENTFKVDVKSEAGVTKTYKVVVTRQDNRSDENGLNDISISNIYFVFKPDILRYDLEVDKEVSSVIVKSSLIDSKSTYVEGSETMTKSLVIGTNKILIKVKAENESIKTYTINIVRNDGKSSVNSLSNLSVVGYEKLIEFIPETLSYSISVPSTMNEVEIKSTMTSTKSTYVESFGNRKVSLNPGLNKIKIKVKSEKGVVKTYTINITREDPKDNTELKTLKIDIEDFKFDPTILEYKLEVSNLTEKLNIETETEEKGTKVNIIGNEKLEIGENTIKIEIISESGKKKTYTLLVNRRDKPSTISKLKDISIKDYDIKFDSNTFEYTIQIKDENKLDITVEKMDPLTKYSVLGNNNLKRGSVIKVIASAEDGSSTEYKIKITKDLDGLIPLGIITLIIVIISIIATRKKKHVKLVKKEKVIKKQKPLESIVIEPPSVEPIEPLVSPITEPVPEVVMPIAEEKVEEEIKKDEVIEDTSEVIEVPNEETKKEDEILEI